MPEPAATRAPAAAAAAPADRVTVVTELVPVGTPEFKQPVGTTGPTPSRLAAAPPDEAARELAGSSPRETAVDSAPADASAVTAGYAVGSDPAAVTPDPQLRNVTHSNEAPASDTSLLLTPLTASRRVTAIPTPAIAARPLAAPTATARVVEAPPIVEPDQKELVLRVLHRYAAAYERLDVEAAKAVYPRVDDIALRKAFNALEAQSVTFQSCGVTISGHDANAHCRGEAAYRPRVGPRTLQRATREWTFDLAKADEVWRIMKATVR